MLLPGRVHEEWYGRTNDKHEYMSDGEAVSPMYARDSPAKCLHEL